jgi:hypothetical protein
MLNVKYIIIFNLLEMSGTMFLRITVCRVKKDNTLK